MAYGLAIACDYIRFAFRTRTPFAILRAFMEDRKGTAQDGDERETDFLFGRRTELNRGQYHSPLRC